MNKRLFAVLIVLSVLIISCGTSENKGNKNDEVPCTHGDSRDIKCGLNKRGLKHETCFEGTWVSNYECVDPDVCIDDYEDVVTCGVLGTRLDVCVEGKWDRGECNDDYLKPDGFIPAESKGRYLYFSAKKIDDKYNSDLYMIDMTTSEPTVVQLTDTLKIDEVSPSSPADNSFMVYANGYYNDPSFSDIRFVKLDDFGKPKPDTDKLIVELKKESCNNDFTTVYFGKGNPSLSLDGTEMVFVDTYEIDVDDFGCPKVAFKPAKVSINVEGNIGTYEHLGWDEGINPGFTQGIPLTPTYLHDTKNIVVSYKGLDQHPVSSEIQICGEQCDSFADWNYLTYQAIWSNAKVAQISIATSMVDDDFAFFRSFTGYEFDTGIYLASDILDAKPHPVYGSYGVYETKEIFLSGFDAVYMASTYRALAFSPDGKLLAVVLTFIDNEIKNERHSNIAILNRETGEVVKTFEFKDSPLREVDGLHWR